MLDGSPFSALALEGIELSYSIQNKHCWPDSKKLRKNDEGIQYILVKALRSCKSAPVLILMWQHDHPGVYTRQVLIRNLSTGIRETQNESKNGI